MSCIVALGTAANSLAQVILDGKLGAGGPVTGPNYSIPAEVGAVRGNNLFHSFQQFDLKPGDVATFSGPANIQNILSRVTGNAPSSIDGTIRSDIGAANFFLINPQGLIFGPNAKVDVSGSFAASSANYLKLADGARFMASLDADDSTLTTAPVSAFGFLDGNAGRIQFQQTKLEGGAGKTISIVGGEITMDGGFVRSPAGQISVASVKSAGEVPIDPSGLSRAEFKTAFPEQGNVTLRNEAQMDASGAGGGRIVIRGGSLVVDNSRIDANTTGSADGRGIDIAVASDVQLSKGQINSLSPSGLGASGSINVSADSIRLIGDGTTDDFFNPTTQISTATGDLFFGGGPAKGGDITLRARDIELVNSAQVSVATFGAGDAGRIDIEASSVFLDARSPFIPTQITANTQGNEGGGKAGDIHIRTDTFEMLNGALVLAASFGSAPAGVIDVDAQSLRLLSGAIFAASAFGSGAGGNIQVRAESIKIDGRDTLGGGPDMLTGIQAVTTSQFAPAPGGNIQIAADSIDLNHNGSIFTTSIAGSLGKGGDIDVTAGNLTLANNSTIRAASEGTGSAGKLTIRSDGDITLASGSAISTSALGSSGGDISVRAGSEIQLINSEINAQAGLDGGNISVRAGNLVYLLNGTLTGRADTTGSGFGNGGNLTIEPSSFLILNKGSLISKSSFGNGGNITILADNFLRSISIIDASAPFGLPGTVTVTAPDVDLSGSLVGLPGDLFDAESQLRPDCGVRLADNISSFIVLGRGGLPIQPGGFLPSGMVLPRNESK